MNTTTITDQAVVKAETRPLSCLKPTQAAAKFGRKAYWIWSILKTDPTFPKPVYLGPSAPVWLESELDAWLLAQAAKRDAA